MDTFLVRTLLVPSTVAILGRWNWWPSDLHDRHLDRDKPSPSAAVSDAGSLERPLNVSSTRACLDAPVGAQWHPGAAFVVDPDADHLVKLDGATLEAQARPRHVERPYLGPAEADLSTASSQMALRLSHQPCSVRA